jgi:hypothetical protein
MGRELWLGPRQCGTRRQHGSGFCGRNAHVWEIPRRPTIRISSPSDRTTISGIVNPVVDAGDNVGVSFVSFYVDGVLTATDSTAPYSFSWDTARAVNGQHTLRAVAGDAAGNSASAQIVINVSNTAPGHGATDRQLQHAGKWGGGVRRVCCPGVCQRQRRRCVRPLLRGRRALRDLDGPALHILLQCRLAHRGGHTPSRPRRPTPRATRQARKYPWVSAA